MMPGSRSLGVGLGGRSLPAATDRLERRWEVLRIAVALPAGERSLRPGELGIALDAPATARSAWLAGRSPERGLRRLWPLASVPVSPSLGLDLVRGVETLRALALSERQEPVDARIGLRDGLLWTEAGLAGLEIDVVATSIRLQADLDRIVARGRLESILRELPPRVSDPGPARDRAKALLERDLALELWDPVADRKVSHSIAAARWRDWVQAQIDPEQPTEPRWRLRSEAIDRDLVSGFATLDGLTFVEPADLAIALIEALDAGSTDLRLRLRHRPRRYVVGAGETLASIGRGTGIPYPWIQAVNPDLDDRLRAGQELEIPPADRFIELPIVEGKRIVVDLDRNRTQVFQDDALLWDWPSSSGIADSPTAPGVFQVQSLEREAYASAWQLRMPYFIGIYQPAPGATVTNGFHGQPIHDRLGQLWLGQVGSRVTYGCILLDDVHARQLFEWVEPGIVVELRSESLDQVR